MGTKITWKYLSIPFNKELHQTLIQQHHASQFIAMIGKYLVKQLEDDSNTSMKSKAQGELLVGEPFKDGLRVALDLSGFNLFLLGKNNKPLSHVSLKNKTKEQVFNELKKILADDNVDVSTLTADLHYAIDENGFTHKDVFTEGMEQDVKENIFYRHNAEVILNETAANYPNAEPVRIWPHHFDTGTLIPIAFNKKCEAIRTIGLGWAVPDNMVNEPYFYISYWSAEKVLGFTELPNPEFGQWDKNGWQGAILKLSDIIKLKSAKNQYVMVKQFFESTMKILFNKYL